MTSDPLIMVLDSPWFWLFWCLLGVYTSAKMHERDEFDLFMFKDFTVFWMAITLFLMGFSLQYSITYGILEAGLGGGGVTQTIYFLIFVGIAVFLGRTLIKTEENTDTQMWTQFMQIIVAFSLGAVFRVIYEMGGLGA